MRRVLALGLTAWLLCAACVKAAPLDGGDGGGGSGGADPSRRAVPNSRRPNAAKLLQQLQRLLAQSDGLPASAKAAKLSKDLVKALSEDARNKQPPAKLTGGALEALSRAAQQAPSPLHQGQLITERGKLQQLMGRAAAAEAALEQAAGLLSAELATWKPPGSHPKQDSQQDGIAGAPSDGQAAAVEAAPSSDAHAAAGPAGDPGKAARVTASAALGTLLDVSAALRQLGKEERANELLSDALAVAPRLPAPTSYLRAAGQLSRFSDEQLAGVLSCTVAAQGATTSPEAAGCAWMKLNPDGTLGSSNKTLADAHRLFYAAHRGFHARKRYPEAWAALQRAKALHFQAHDFTEKDYPAELAGLRDRFPPASPNASSGDTAEEAGQGQPSAEEGVGHQGRQSAQQKAAAGRTAGVAHVLLGAAGDSCAWLRRQVQGLLVLLRSLAGSSASRSEGEGRPHGGGGSGGHAMRPIFVLGLPRSGSSLVEQILASHPDVWGAGEHSNMRGVASRLEQLLEAGQADAEGMEALRQRYLSNMRAKVPADRRLSTRWVVDKGLGNAWVVGHIAALMPESCVVHAVRHPADAALSAYQQSFFPHKVPWSFNLSTIAAQVEAHHQVMALWDAALPGRVLHLHYAHMVADQEGTTRRLVEHCGLPWHPSLLRFYETERAVQTASQLQVKKPIYTSSLNKWPVYKEGLAPLLLQLRGTILRYEEQAGLPSSHDTLDELALAAGEQRSHGLAGDWLAGQAEDVSALTDQGAASASRGDLQQQAVGTGQDDGTRGRLEAGEQSTTGGDAAESEEPRSREEL